MGLSYIQLFFGILALYVIKRLYIDPLVLSPLKCVPGPKIYAITKWRLAYDDWTGMRTRNTLRLHQVYGPVVRIGPTEVSFNDLTALRTIYGPGSKYGRTRFYRMFDVYGTPNLFTFHSTKEHGDRKRLLAHAYSKSSILKEPVATKIEAKVREYMSLVSSEPGGVSEIFTTLHYYSLDNITAFIYGKHGSTSAMAGNEADRALIHDVVDPCRRKLFWFFFHLNGLTTWLYTRTGVMERAVRPFLPMQKPTTYTGIRKFALQAYKNAQMGALTSKDAGPTELGNDALARAQYPSILDRLALLHHSCKQGGLKDLEIASECADHFLAGIDTTSDTLMFLIWSLSRPENKKYQEKLRREVCDIAPDSLNEHGFPTVEASDKCDYLNAVIKETLRLYAPLPSAEPRSLVEDSVIDGYTIPAGTTVEMAPYLLHRNPKVFEDALSFNPDRWLGPDSAELNRWFWAFSSGGRMCIGMHLAMAEMTTLTAALYRKYGTSLAPGFENSSPGITARFELFSDDRFANIQVSFYR
ncbi:cytochrome P450 [Corynespora cassiicola Philippines]|uniref:Cytochrome P450 n=1 Tax=Corynespora cassiicola Philippines TaxID=1448308 RepID=A0A2T2NJT8_CORCC|nr:cytochrome P450 [Corynespora cassiicola Philippines]